MSDEIAPTGPPFLYRILFSVVAHPCRQLGVEHGVPEEFATSREIWLRAASGRRGTSGAIDRIRAMLKRRLLFGFVPINWKAGTTLLAKEDILVGGLTVLGFDFSQGILPSVRAKRVLELPFSAPILVGGIGGWQDENDFFDGACVLHLDFEFDTEFAEPVLRSPRLPARLRRTIRA
ncbi:hypothetical protein [Salinarimonas rosea]|uniref:hypothetical protein n=1 Tax=Salinarimonas rosea TaxID=552063 RepID=UPI00048B3AE9|nr:hypothetical protein [Salinarimonas rosea]